MKLTVRKLVMGLSYTEDCMIVLSLFHDWYQRATNRQTDGQNLIANTALCIYTVSIKTFHFYFYDNFAKCRPISIILSVLYSQINCGIWWNKIFYRTWILLLHYLVKVKCSTVQRFIHTRMLYLAGLICTTSKWANYRSWQFFKSFHPKNHVMNGNSLICWTHALSR